MCNNLKAAGCSCFLGILPKVNDGIKAQTIVISQLPRSIMVHLYIHNKFHTKGDHHMVYRRIVLNPSRCASSPSKYPWNTCECLHACKFPRSRTARRHFSKLLSAPQLAGPPLQTVWKHQSSPWTPWLLSVGRNLFRTMSVEHIWYMRQMYSNVI